MPQGHAVLLSNPKEKYKHEENFDGSSYPFAAFPDGDPRSEHVHQQHGHQQQQNEQEAPQKAQGYQQLYRELHCQQHDEQVAADLEKFANAVGKGCLPAPRFLFQHPIIVV